jgi:hypothetical protein
MKHTHQIKTMKAIRKHGRRTTFHCNICQRQIRFNTNWLGHGGRILCNGLKTMVHFASDDRDERELFAPTPKQAAEIARKECHQAQFERTGAKCTPGHEDHCMDAEKGSPCDCGCGGANHAANAPALPTGGVSHPEECPCSECWSDERIAALRGRDKVSEKRSDAMVRRHANAGHSSVRKQST